MSCFSCSKLSDRDRQVVKYYKTLFETTGKEYYVYRLNANEAFKFVEKQYFSKILQTQIKPNFDNGAEYYSIQEFKGN